MSVPVWMQEIFDTDKDVLFLLDADMCIAKCNPGWEKFAAENGGVGISGPEVRGRSIFEYIPDVLVEFYEKKYSEARSTGRWIGFDYECSSPDAIRLFHMALRSTESLGMLVVNSRLTHHPSPLLTTGETLPDSAYVSAGGFLTMCAHCRRTRRRDETNTWDWVSRFLREKGYNVSHGLCPRCTAYLYPDLQTHDSKH